MFFSSVLFKLWNISYTKDLKIIIIHFCCCCFLSYSPNLCGCRFWNKTLPIFMFVQEGGNLNAYVQSTTLTWKFKSVYSFCKIQFFVKHFSETFSFSRIYPVLHCIERFLMQYTTNWILIHLFSYVSFPRKNINPKMPGSNFINSTYHN